MSYPATNERIFKALFQLQRAATRAVGQCNDELAEAIVHHCALMVASATAPSDKLVGRFVNEEERALKRLLMFPTPDAASLAAKGRYLQAFLAYDRDWLSDAGVPHALLAGMAGAA